MTLHPILSFWFGSFPTGGQVSPEVKARWFRKSPAFDAECREGFQSDVEAIRAGAKLEMLDELESSLAYILLADQMPRNIYRDTPEAFSCDERALKAALQTIARPDYTHLHLPEQNFVLMPLMHSEDLAVQDRAVVEFQALAKRGFDSVEWAVRHRDIVKRFGRFPHRNDILGRESTEEELHFLSQPGSSF